MNPTQTALRNKVAQQTRRVVERQRPLELTEFLAQGRKRSRQQRKLSAGLPTLPFVGLPQAVATA